jgi:hypothetical protein
MPLEVHPATSRIMHSENQYLPGGLLQQLVQCVLAFNLDISNAEIRILLDNQCNRAHFKCTPYWCTRKPYVKCQLQLWTEVFDCWLVCIAYTSMNPPPPTHTHK